MISDIICKPSISQIFDFPRRQKFSIPSSIIFYILKNPISAQGLQKLQKTCKYFFAKNKIIVVDDKVNLGPGNNSHYYYQVKNSEGRYISLYFNNIKLWLIGSLMCDLRIPINIYRCTLKVLTIQNQTLKSNELDFFLNGGNIKSLDLREIEIIDDEGNRISVTCDQILAKVPKIEGFLYYNKNETYTSETFEKMYLLELNSKLNVMVISISHLSQTEDLKVLCNFLRKNMANKSHFHIYFFMDNSDDYFNAFTNMVEEELIPWKEENGISILTFISIEDFEYSVS